MPNGTEALEVGSEVIGGSFFCDHRWGNRQSATTFNHYGEGIHMLVERSFCQQWCGAELRVTFKVTAPVAIGNIELDIPDEPTDPDDLEIERTEFSCLSDRPDELEKLVATFNGFVRQEDGRYILTVPIVSASFLSLTLLNEGIIRDWRKE